MTATVAAWVRSAARPLADRLDLRLAERSGPPYAPSHRRIIIDITSACDLGCDDCDRSCGLGQAPSGEHMGIDQIAAFIAESIDARRAWRRITLEGGEPSLHPRLGEIVDLLLGFIRRHSPRTSLELVTNGLGPASRQAEAALRRTPVIVINTRKALRAQPHHLPFNLAPCDAADAGNADPSEGCPLPACYGLGLTRHGYYPHPVCGGIDRVFGFDIGRQRLPAPGDQMRDQLARLCRYCGLFGAFGRRGPMDRRRASGGNGSAVSPSWRDAYERYRVAPPALTAYGPAGRKAR